MDVLVREKQVILSEIKVGEFGIDTKNGDVYTRVNVSNSPRETQFIKLNDPKNQYGDKIDENIRVRRLEKGDQVIITVE